MVLFAGSSGRHFGRREKSSPQIEAISDPGNIILSATTFLISVLTSTTMSNARVQTYAQRREKFKNVAARQLLETVERKRTNLCVSVDVTKKDDFLNIIDTVGPYVCLVKVCHILFETSRE